MGEFIKEPSVNYESTVKYHHYHNHYVSQSGASPNSTLSIYVFNPCQCDTIWNGSVWGPYQSPCTDTTNGD